jgi:glycosyltransferase involved in cell wall biosynthesis
VASKSPNEWAAKCAAVIPCFNEANTIGALVLKARAHVREVLVVDDGSTDLTREHAEQAGALVLCHKQRCGKGASLRTGWKHAQLNGFTWAVCLDGDGQHDPEEIPAFAKRAQQTRAELVIGNRMENPSGMPLIRRWVNLWMSRRLSALAGKVLPDSQCGFRLMNLEAWLGLSVSSQHFEIESEVLLFFLRAQHRVEFVPIRAIYKKERSKINPVQDTIRWFRWWRAVSRPREEGSANGGKQEGFPRGAVIGG